MGKGKNKRKAQTDSYERFYDVDEMQVLGEGGNAKVYTANDKETGESVALKVLLHFDKEKIARFKQEISVMDGLRGQIKGVMPILRSDKEYCWYSMPTAQSLLDYLKSKNINQLIDVVSPLLISLAETLELLHKQGIHHRDIKPANMYILDGIPCVGDFGLVEFPDNDNLTRDDRGLGAIFTIAPEMKRNPVNADGAKADVFSFAKTIWMLLTLDEKGFDGQYDWNDDAFRLHHYEHLKDEYFVEVEYLLKTATESDPNKRPTMPEVKDALIKWGEIRKDNKLCQVNEWRFLLAQIFPNMSPQSATITKPEQIVYILNVIGKSPAYNHMLYSDGGGLDFESAQMANEEGCIYVISNSFYDVLKPKALNIETFADSRWNYFLLEADNLKPIFGGDYDGEDLVEDVPGHYVDSTCAVYGVYDYHSGVKLPLGSKRVTRYTKGKFLIVNKMGPYNKIQGTYDGRHGVMSPQELRGYVLKLENLLAKAVEKGVSEEVVLQSKVFNQNPYEERMKQDSCLLKAGIEHNLPSAKDYILANFYTWNFSEVLKENQNIGSGKLEYYFIMEGVQDFLQKILGNYWYLAEDGSLQNSKESLLHIFFVKNREIAIQIREHLNGILYKRCKGFDTDCLKSSIGFSIEWKSVGKPTHLFTKEEIEYEMRNADDRMANRLVIDEDGFVHVIPADSNLGELYPVYHEAWGAYKNYVGKFANLRVETEYRNSLACWVKYLQTGQQQYCDCDQYCNVEEVIQKIKRLM